MSSINKNIIIALLPVVFLVTLLVISIQFVFKDAALDGAIQLSLLLSAVFAASIAIYQGTTWKALEEGVVKNLSIAIPSILILLMIGGLAGIWLISGIIPSLLYYGLEVIHPRYLLVTSCFSCTIVSLITGTSYATIATIGVALMAIGRAYGINEGMVAGAIISGAYFGDKLSPLSDTTNLAPSVSGTTLFLHIRSMLWTTTPSIIMSMLLFLSIGMFTDYTSYSFDKIAFLQHEIKEHFTVSYFFFIVPMFTFFLIFKKVAALPALVVSIVIAAIVAIVFQPHVINVLSDSKESLWKSFEVPFRAIYGTMSISTKHAALERLFSTGGMSGMLNTIWLILCAMVFGGIMEKAGFLASITKALVILAKSTTSLVLSTVVSCISMNIIAADQYISIIIPGKMFVKTYQEKGVKLEVLSRTLEDSGTVTSVLIPWNTCGITQATVLGVATWVYAPYCFFCLLSPCMSILFSFLYKKKCMV